MMAPMLDHDDIGRQIGERMHGIGDHGAAPANETGRQFSGRQHEIDDETEESYPIDGPQPPVR